jgi:hypothetical protein
MFATHKSTAAAIRALLIEQTARQAAQGRVLSPLALRLLGLA